MGIIADTRELHYNKSGLSLCCWRRSEAVDSISSAEVRAVMKRVNVLITLLALKIGD